MIPFWANYCCQRSKKTGCVIYCPKLRSRGSKNVIIVVWISIYVIDGIVQRACKM